MAAGHVFLVVLSLIIVESAVLTGRARYCRDPDTGKLHAVNSTWASSTFCGNYTCKLRRRNVTETQYTPLRQLNITSVKNHISQDNITVTIEDRTEPEIEPIIHKDRSITDNSENQKVRDTNELQQKNEVTDNENRYLTEKEIKSISSVLETVKKSDLDAIVDIYNLAQDIYNEMDKATNEDVIDDSVNATSSDKTLRNVKKSYWYEPVANKAKADMDYQSSNNAAVTIQPNKDAPTYFNGALTHKDFGKLPYYYPMSAFQRDASYIHQPTALNKVNKPKPCQAKQTKDMQVAAQNIIKPSYLLPYPFAYIHQYNYTDYPNNLYYNQYPWSYHNRPRQYQPYYNAYIAPNAPIPNAVLINPHLHEDVVADIEQKPVEGKDLLNQVLVKTKENIIPDWKTEQLSSQILDEVRANIDTSKFLKAFPFRKKLTLEKVGKLIKLDELTRYRRSAGGVVDEEQTVPVEDVIKGKVTQGTVIKETERRNTEEVTTEDPRSEEQGEFDTYIEKTTCQTRTVPGYFRYGNLTQPYPECCPQMINNR